jgi:hypothetical protein
VRGVALAWCATRSGCVGLLTSFACLTLGGIASGAEGDGGPCPCESDAGARRHDGFFARSVPGLVLYWAHVDGSSRVPRRSGIRGVGQGGELALGGTPAPGLVVGGSVWTGRLDPVFVEDGRRVSSDDDSVKLTQLRLGPFVDYYPDASLGFHGTAALALVAEFESDAKGDAIEPIAYGVSLATGVGHEWFVSDEVSFGFLARFALGGVTRGARERSLFIVPELALSATYH